MITNSLITSASRLDMNVDFRMLKKMDTNVMMNYEFDPGCV